jgi:hypothetical protein
VGDGTQLQSNSSQLFPAIVVGRRHAAPSDEQLELQQQHQLQLELEEEQQQQQQLLPPLGQAQGQYQQQCSEMALHISPQQQQQQQRFIAHRMGTHQLTELSRPSHLSSAASGKSL